LAKEDSDGDRGKKAVFVFRTWTGGIFTVVFSIMALSAILGLVIGYVEDNRDFVGERVSSSSAPKSEDNRDFVVLSMFNAEVRVSPPLGGSPGCNRASIDIENDGSLGETDFGLDGRCLECSLFQLCFLPCCAHELIFF
jgi:hypothetical protein